MSKEKCSYSAAFENMYVCVKIRSVFNNFINGKIQRTVPGESCNNIILQKNLFLYLVQLLQFLFDYVKILTQELK